MQATQVLGNHLLIEHTTGAGRQAPDMTAGAVSDTAKRVPKVRRNVSSGHGNLTLPGETATRMKAEISSQAAAPWPRGPDKRRVPSEHVRATILPLGTSWGTLAM